jgi:hypothetical protein
MTGTSAWNVACSSAWMSAGFGDSDVAPPGDTEYMLLT